MSHQEDNKKIGELIKDIRIATLSSIEADGDIHSRPMGTMDYEFDGNLWFFTQKDSVKVDEIQARHRVAVAYADSHKNSYVCLTGDGELVLDKEKMKELWTPFLKAWFPEGLDDPQLALLKIKIDRAEYWDGPSSKLVQLYTFAKAALTGGDKGDTGEHGTISL